ncbi:hypothetical protein OJ998_22050 [Solirubrobacter taibaiensis]|nr:hypothetical protein [Solirubrobacter taibaiensis]
MPPEAEYHSAALDLLSAAPERERMLPERAVTYPAAVVEWFVLGQLEELEVDEQRLRVAPEFYVYVDEGDDPPVYHDDEGLVSVSFSNFAFDLVAAQRLRGLHLSATGPVLDDASLARLALRRGPVTRTDALVIHRFYGPHEYATVRWTPGAEEAVWHLEADSERALDALRETIDRVAGVPRRGLMSKLARRKPR